MKRAASDLLSCAGMAACLLISTSRCLQLSAEVSRKTDVNDPGQEAVQEAPANSEIAVSQHPGNRDVPPERPTVRAEIIAIGDELCYGRVYDTNSFWIADQVTRRGVLVQRIVCVRDDVRDICSVLKDALDRKPTFLFITGGLGHTSDDRTREALSAATGRRIVRRPDILEYIAKQRNVPVEQLPPHFAISTSSVEGATCFPNPAGVSPVIIIDEGGTRIIALPGPPREVYACFSAHLANIVQEATGYHSLSKQILINMHESELTPLMTEVMREFPGTYVKALVGGYRADSGMPIEVMAFSPSEKLCREICDNAVEKLLKLAAEKDKNRPQKL